MPAPILQIDDDIIINWWNITSVERSAADDGTIMIRFTGTSEPLLVEDPVASQVVKYLADIGESLVSKEASKPEADPGTRFGNLMGDDA